MPSTERRLNRVAIRTLIERVEGLPDDAGFTQLEGLGLVFAEVFTENGETLALVRVLDEPQEALVTFTGLRSAQVHTYIRESPLHVRRWRDGSAAKGAHFAPTSRPEEF